MPPTSTRQPANIIGPRLRAARRGEAGQPRALTLDELAALLPDDLGLDRSALGRIERQARAAKDYEVVALAKTLGVDVRWLLDCQNDSGSS